jgi:hypothetical protein
MAAISQSAVDAEHADRSDRCGNRKSNDHAPGQEDCCQRAPIPPEWR